jgi:hypothetical protein
MLGDERDDRIASGMEISYEARLGGPSKGRGHNGVDRICIEGSLFSYEHGATIRISISGQI